MDTCPDDTQLSDGVCVGAVSRNNTTLIAASTILAALVVVLVVICIVKFCAKKSQRKSKNGRKVVRVDQGEVLHGAPVTGRLNSREVEMQNINAQGVLTPRG